MSLINLLGTYIIPSLYDIYSDSDIDSDISDEPDKHLDINTNSAPDIIADTNEVSNAFINHDKTIHLNYNSIYTLLNNTEIAYLPKMPVPFEKIQIINLGNTNIKIVSSNETNIFNNFYAPNGNKFILLQKNNTYELIYIKSEEKSFWICK